MKMKIMQCLMRMFLLVFALVVTNSVPVLAETYYVALGGNDNNAGTLDSPLGTIQKAMGMAQAGDKILVKAGIYAGGILISNSGTPEKPIILKAYGDGETEIKGRFEQKKGFKLAEGCKYTYEIEEKGDVASVLVNLDTTKAVIEGLWVESIGELEKMSFVYYYDRNAGKLYLRYLGDNPDKEQSIYVFRDEWGLSVAGSNVVVDGFTFSHFAGEGMGVNGKNVTVRNCKFYLCGSSIGTAGGGALLISGQDAENIKIKNCIMTRVQNGILLLGGKNIEITHNTIYKTRAHGMMIYGSSNATIKNNIIYAGGPSGAVLYIYKNSTDTLTLDYNCYLDYNTSICIYWEPTDTRFPTYWDYKAAVKTQDRHSISADPMFVSAVQYAEDLNLKPESPCIGKAEDGFNIGAYPKGLPDQIK